MITRHTWNWWIEDDGEGGVLHLDDAHPHLIMMKPELKFDGHTWSVSCPRDWMGNKWGTERFETWEAAVSAYEEARRCQRQFHLSNLGCSDGDVIGAIELIEADWVTKWEEWLLDRGLLEPQAETAARLRKIARAVALKRRMAGVRRAA